MMVIKKSNTLSYVKGLPTPINELNALGFTNFEMFLTAYEPIYREAVCETVNQLISCQNQVKFDKSKWNTYLQNKYQLLKRHANGIIADAKGKVSSAVECRKDYLKQLKGKLTSAQTWLKRQTKLIKQTNKFYNKTKKVNGKKVPLWQNSRQSCKRPLSTSLKFQTTNLNHLRFLVHNKKRYVEHLKRKIEKLRTSPIRVYVPKGNVFVVGSKDETCGNQISQWSGDFLKFRVPPILEDKFGFHVITKLGNFDRNLNRLPITGALTWHFYQKNNKWNACVQFTPTTIPFKTISPNLGVISLDLNPSSLDWTELDKDGNLVKHGSISLSHGCHQGKTQAEFVEASLFLVDLSLKTRKPIVHERLDFSRKKQSLRETNKKYSRMLSSWGYHSFFKTLTAIASNRGVEIKAVASQYTSLIGMIKYMRMYGLNSGVAAAIAIGRRGMRLSERLPQTIKTALSVRDRAHLWRAYYQLNKLLKAELGYIKRNTFYCMEVYPNWACKVKQVIESTPVV